MLVVVVVALAITVAGALLARRATREPPTASPSAAVIASPTGLATEVAGRQTPSPTEAPTLSRLLGQLALGSEHREGYRRALFHHWIDADGDGCDTHDEVLISESLIAPDVGSGCRLSGGLWLSLYDDVTITEVAELEVDHLVALSEAWESGAWAWTSDRRERFANDLDDPHTLIAVSGASNRSKGGRDPSKWLPPEPAAACPFLEAWVAVKIRWGLAVDAAEKQVLADFATQCPDSRMTVAIAP